MFWSQGTKIEKRKTISALRMILIDLSKAITQDQSARHAIDLFSRIPVALVLAKSLHCLS